jgi:hypothetical protein
MKARSKELLDRSIAATLAAIEIYNKPDFLYRGEAFAVLAVNGWELLLKAKWLHDHSNNMRSLFIKDNSKGAVAKKGKRRKIKLSRSGNPLTYSIDYLAKKLVEKGALDKSILANIQLLLEIRDTAIHFYHQTGRLQVDLQRIGAASLENFVILTKQWFNQSLSKYNFYLMPLSFMAAPSQMRAVLLNEEEKKFLNYVKTLESNTEAVNSNYAVTINIEVAFNKSKVKNALDVRITNDPKATAVRLTDEQVREKYPWSYLQLTAECRKRYSDFKAIDKYHKIRKLLINDKRYCHTRKLDPENPKSAKQDFYNPNIFNEFDKHYQKT